MRIKPTGDNLLQTVQSVLREEILPNLPAAQQYSLRMALNAIGIATRQLESGDHVENIEAATLGDMVDEPARDENDTLNHRFARMVRAGRADQDEALQILLWAQTLNRVRESAPRYLVQEGIG